MKVCVKTNNLIDNFVPTSYSALTNPHLKAIYDSVGIGGLEIEVYFFSCGNTFEIFRAGRYQSVRPTLLIFERNMNF